MSLLLFTVVFYDGFADEFSSPLSLLDKELTPAMAERLPRRDCSTPQRAFLGFLRGLVEGNIRDQLFCLTDDAKKDFANVTNETDISEEKARGLAEEIKKRGSKIKLESFHATPDTLPTRIVAVISETHGKRTMREKLEFTIIKTNGQYKISTINEL